jgi:hypothetical protein
MIFPQNQRVRFVENVVALSVLPRSWSTARDPAGFRRRDARAPRTNSRILPLLFRMVDRIAIQSRQDDDTPSRSPIPTQEETPAADGRDLSH